MAGFPLLFQVFWRMPETVNDRTGSDSQNQARRGSQATGLSYFSESQAEDQALTGLQRTAELYSGGASDASTLSQRDFRFVFNPHDMRRIERIVDDLSRRMQKRLRRRAVSYTHLTLPTICSV